MIIFKIGSIPFSATTSLVSDLVSPDLNAPNKLLIVGSFTTASPPNIVTFLKLYLLVLTKSFVLLFKLSFINIIGDLFY